MVPEISIARQLRQSLLLRRVLGFAWHLFGITLCYVIAFVLRLFPNDLAFYKHAMLTTLPIAWANYLFFVVVFGLYRGLWSFFSFRDCFRYAYVYLLATALFACWVFLLKAGSPNGDYPIIEGNSFNGYPRMVFPIFYLLLVGWEVGGRGLMRLIRDFQQQGQQAAILGPRTILVGSPEESDQLVRSLVNPRLGLGEVSAIVCDDSRRSNATLHGIRMLGDIEQIGQLAKEVDAEMILFVPPFNTPNQIKRIMGLISDAEVAAEFRVIPSLKDIAHGHVDVSSLRRVEIEDLLNRKPNVFDRSIIETFIAGKTVLVTGAGGSIGSEICRQVASYGPAKLVLFDHSEFNLFEIQRELSALNGGIELIACMGDVKRALDLERAIEQSGGIDILYHAAAYKHVHLAEENVASVFLNNVVGTNCVADVAARAGVGQFILISTDKAVRPTSVMGATKRIAERCIMERDRTSESPNGETQFKAVRFGNVLGSSGSVIPIFKRQIAEGGPVTVTSKDVTRYFMTIPEAVELVLMAGAVGEDRNIMVLEMGEPVKIDLLARQLIELSGLVPDKDIPIRYTGLRKGEKEYEELLTDDENVTETAYEKIWVMEKERSKLRPVDLAEIRRLAEANDGPALRKLAMELIPENRLGSE